MSKELTADDVNWGWSEDVSPGPRSVKDELLSLALTELHTQRVINERDRERLIRLLNAEKDKAS